MTSKSLKDFEEFLLKDDTINDFLKEKGVSFDEFEQIAIEAGEEKYRCYQKAMEGDVDALMKCSLRRGMITQEQYEDFLRIEAKEGEYSDF